MRFSLQNKGFFGPGRENRDPDHPDAAYRTDPDGWNFRCNAVTKLPKTAKLDKGGSLTNPSHMVHLQGYPLLGVDRHQEAGKE